MEGGVLGHGAGDETKEDGSIHGDDDDRNREFRRSSEAKRIGLRSGESNKHASSNESTEYQDLRDDLYSGDLLPSVLRPVNVLFDGKSGKLIKDGSEYYADLARHRRRVDFEKNGNKIGKCPQGSGC